MAGLLSLVIGGNMASEFITQKAVFAAAQLVFSCVFGVDLDKSRRLATHALNVQVCNEHASAQSPTDSAALRKFSDGWVEFEFIEPKALFPINLLLVLTTGGQLFTGNSATMAIGIYEKKCTTKDTSFTKENRCRWSSNSSQVTLLHLITQVKNDRLSRTDPPLYDTLLEHIFDFLSVPVHIHSTKVW